MQSGLTQEELAERSGLSIRTISALERAHTTMPHRRSVELLAAALCIEEATLEHFREAARLDNVVACPSCGGDLRVGELISLADTN